MIKHIFIILVLISPISANLGDTYFANESGHTDNIYGVYNDSCIETVNYLYLFYNSPDDENITEAWENTSIWLENITQIEDKAFKADIYYID